MAEEDRHESGSEPMRLVLVLSGAVALGTFEAGVLYELMRALKAGAPLTVDVIAGASAGALVGAMTAKCLVTGVPYEQILPRWTEYTLQQLADGYEGAEEAKRRGKLLDRGILSSAAVRRILAETLVKDSVERSFRPGFPAPRLCLTMTLTNLDGLPPIDGSGEGHQFTEAVTFRFTPPDAGRPDRSPYPSAIWRRVGQVAQASSSFPGAFDPVSVPWAERIRIPGQLEELWENDDRLEQLNQSDPRIQAKMLYADGGILDNQPAERAIAALPLVTGGRGEPGLRSLVYDPRRCVLFIEPEPPYTTPDTIRRGTHRTWFDLFSRAVDLWTLASSPYTGRPRVHTSNQKLNRLFRFLADLGRHITVDRQIPTPHEARHRFAQRYPELDVLRRAGTALNGEEGPLGLIAPDLFARSVHEFYEWLSGDGFYVDLEWLERLPPGRVREAHGVVQDALIELRGAYLGLWGLDKDDPVAHQAVLQEIHTSLAISLGLTQPWVGLNDITPEDPRILQGEELHNFGGFFSAEFLRHDYEVGRYYAHLWLREAIPGYVVPDPPELPPLREDGLNWRHLWQNRGPLWRMAGRLLVVILEAAGLRHSGGGQLLVRLLGLVLLLSIAHGFVMLIGAWFGWIRFPAEYEPFRFWLLLGTSLFPLTLGLLLGLALRWRR